jgi:hypothetical protein
MTKDTEALETLLDQAARARRLAIAIEGDPAAARLERLAEELEAKIVRNSFTTMQVRNQGHPVSRAYFLPRRRTRADAREFPLRLIKQ